MGVGFDIKKVTWMDLLETCHSLWFSQRDLRIFWLFTGIYAFLVCGHTTTKYTIKKKQFMRWQLPSCVLLISREQFWHLTPQQTVNIRWKIFNDFTKCSWIRRSENQHLKHLGTAAKPIAHHRLNSTKLIIALCLAHFELLLSAGVRSFIRWPHSYSV